MTEKIIFTDCDGVLLDWELAFREWMLSMGHTHVSPNEYSIDKQYGIERSVGKDYVKEFNDSEAIGSLVAFREAKIGIDALVAAGYKFVVITSLSLFADAQTRRLKNLLDAFGTEFLKELVCLDTGADKDESLAYYINKYPTVAAWIEDKYENAHVGYELGLKTFLIDHGHNGVHEDKGMHRVHNIKEVAEHLLK